MWFHDKKRLSQAIDFLLEYSIVYDWSALATKTTPCISFEKDLVIEDDLVFAISEYLDSLPRTELRAINRLVSMLLGERHYVRRKALIKLFSRLLADGDPRENRDLIANALILQISDRVDKLNNLLANHL